MNNWIKKHKELLSSSKLSDTEQIEWLEKLQNAYAKIEEAREAFKLASQDLIIFGQGKLKIFDDGDIIHIPYRGDDDEI